MTIRFTRPGLLRQDRVWIDKDGNTWFIRADGARGRLNQVMTTNHIDNTIKFLESNAEEIWHAYRLEYLVPVGFARGELQVGLTISKSHVKRSVLYRALVREWNRRRTHGEAARTSASPTITVHIDVDEASLARVRERIHAALGDLPFRSEVSR